MSSAWPRLASDWPVVGLRRVMSKVIRPPIQGHGVITAYRDGQVTLRSSRREDGYTLSTAESGYQGVEEGDFVFHGLDAFAGAVGISDSRGNSSPVYHVCVPSREGDARFFAYCCRVLGYQGFLELQAGTVRQRAVDFRNWTILAELPLPNPHGSIQRAVADFLDAETARIDALIDKKRRMIDLANERITSINDQAVLAARGTERPISALATYVNGWPFAPHDFTASGLPVVRIQQLVDPGAQVDRFDGHLPDRVRLRDGDLIFSWSGSLQVRRWRRGPAYLNQHLFKVVPKQGITIDWLECALNTATRLFDRHMHGSAMTHITQPMMKLVRIPLPTRQEQEKVARSIAHAMSWCEQLRGKLSRQIELLREHRQALITAAVTGEMEVPGMAA